jgi:hypothetical protein
MKKNHSLTWTDNMQTAFDKMSLLMVADMLSAFPDHYECIDVYTDSSDYQVGMCIMQDGHQVTYYSKKAY